MKDKCPALGGKACIKDDCICFERRDFDLFYEPGEIPEFSHCNFYHRRIEATSECEETVEESDKTKTIKDFIDFVVDKKCRSICCYADDITRPNNDCIDCGTHNFIQLANEYIEDLRGYDHAKD